MPYQIIYSSQSTMPMQSDELEELLAQARAKNAAHGISGALVYADGMFLQILEGARDELQALMATIAKDLRHEAVTVLREGEMPSARFGSWGMAYVSATPAQVARWAGVGDVTEEDEATTAGSNEVHRTARFAQDILALLKREQPTEPLESRAADNDRGTT